MFFVYSCPVLSDIAVLVENLFGGGLYYEDYDTAVGVVQDMIPDIKPGEGGFIMVISLVDPPKEIEFSHAMRLALYIRKVKPDYSLTSLDF